MVKNKSGKKDVSQKERICGIDYCIVHRTTLPLAYDVYGIEKVAAAIASGKVVVV